MTTSDWSIIIHGGAANSCPDVERQRHIKKNLTLVTQQAAESLERGGQAKDIALQAVSALECPLFNAGLGSVLTKDGDHEVNDNESHNMA